MKRLIPDSALTLQHLPAPTDAKAVFAFAMSFDGYGYFGSFEAAAENARLGRRATLADLRNELFMSARASRHSGNEDFLVRYAELLPFFQRALSLGKLT